MKKQLITTALAAGTLAVTFVGQVSPANALALNTCVGTNYNISNKVTPNIGCQISSTETQDFLNTNPITVNAEKFFGNTDWLFGGKIGESEPSNILNVSGSGKGQSGSWTIGNYANYASSDIMAIFKDGGKTTLVGYLLSQGTANWTSPFVNPPFNGNSNQTFDVSHVSFYYRNAQAVPTPAAVLPALLGMGAAAIRKKKNTSDVTQDA